MEYKLSAEGIEAAACRIAEAIHKTPIFTSDILNAYVASLTTSRTGPKLYFKCENLQKTGSFKCRGASNAVAKLLSGPEKDQIKGFVTHSSGNHGQALAFASKKFETKCVVVVPSNAPKAKIQAIEGYEAKTVFVEPTMEARKGKCNGLAEKEGLKIVDPHDDWDIMEGQGTLAIEIIEQVPDVEGVLVSVGGGGLIGGISQWFHERKPDVQVIGVEPEGKNILESIKAGKRLWTTGVALDTIADGVRVRPLGEKCFEVMQHVSHKKIYSVNNEDIRFAWKLIWERLKLVVEASSVLPLAAIIKYPEDFKDMKSVVLILCGGNVDFVDPSLAQ